MREFHHCIFAFVFFGDDDDLQLKPRNVCSVCANNLKIKITCANESSNVDSALFRLRLSAVLSPFALESFSMTYRVFTIQVDASIEKVNAAIVDNLLSLGIAVTFLFCPKESEK